MQACRIESARDRAGPLLTPVLRLFFPHFSSHTAFRRTAAVIAINCLRAIHRFNIANRVVKCAVFLGQTAESHLHQPELALDDAQRVLQPSRARWP